MTDATPDHFMLAGEMMDGIIDDLEGYPESVTDAAQVLADVVGAEDVDWAGPRSPGVVATACIYVADYAIRQDDRTTQEQLCEMAPGSHPTVREYYRDIPEVFFEHASGRDLKKLEEIPVNSDLPEGTTALDVLRVFRDAERAGIGIRNIELDADPSAVRRLGHSLEEVRG